MYVNGHTLASLRSVYAIGYVYGSDYRVWRTDEPFQGQPPKRLISCGPIDRYGYHRR